MAETYHVKARVVDSTRQTSYYRMPSVTKGFQDVMVDGALFAIFNSENSGRLVKVHHLSLEPDRLTRIGNQPADVVFALTRCSTLDGGEPLTPIKLESSVADLPSQVKVVRGPHTVTTGSTFRVKKQQSGHHEAVDALVKGSFLGWSGHNKRDGGYSMRSMLKSSDSAAQSITLREGQGLTFASVTGQTSIQRSFHDASFRIRDTTNGRSYFYDFQDLVSIDQPFFTIFNGSGSGVVLTVGNISFGQTRTSATNFGTYQSDCLYIDHISGCEDGVDIAPTPFDTTNTLLPNSNVLIRSGPVVTMFGADARGMKTAKFGRGDQTFRRLQMADAGVVTDNTLGGGAWGLPMFPMFGSEGPHGNGFTTRNSFYEGAGGDPITLRSGEGIAASINMNITDTIGLQQFTAQTGLATMAGIIEAVITVEKAPDGLPVAPAPLRAPIQQTRWV